MYKALTLDIRVEILEESLLNASTTAGEVLVPPPPISLSSSSVSESGMMPPLVAPPVLPMSHNLNTSNYVRPMTSDTMVADRVKNRGVLIGCSRVVN